MRKAELIRFTEMLLQAVQDADWDTYTKLTDQQVTCFEPETVNLVTFHIANISNTNHFSNK